MREKQNLHRVGRIEEEKERAGREKEGERVGREKSDEKNVVRKFEQQISS